VQSELQACVLRTRRPIHCALTAVFVLPNRKREQTSSGQHVLHLQPAQELGAFDGGDVQRGAAVIPTHAELCNTPAGAAAHLRNMRRVVLLARTSSKG